MTEFGDEDFNAIYYKNKPNWVIRQINFSLMITTFSK
jgi:hypothetical protein